MRFVDSNIFVYHLAADPLYKEKAEQILTRIEKGEPAYTSTLVVAQVCSYLMRKKAWHSIPVFLDFLRSLPGLGKCDTTFEDFSVARVLMERMGLYRCWDDLVIAAQMRRLGIGEIYSNDKDFDAIPGVRRIF